MIQENRKQLIGRKRYKEQIIKINIWRLYMRQSFLIFIAGLILVYLINCLVENQKYIKKSQLFQYHNHVLNQQSKCNNIDNQYEYTNKNKQNKQDEQNRNNVNNKQDRNKKEMKIKMNIQKNVWMYQDENKDYKQIGSIMKKQGINKQGELINKQRDLSKQQERQIFRILNSQNTRSIIQKDGYKINKYSTINYKQYLSQSSIKSIQQLSNKVLNNLSYKEQQTSLQIQLLNIYNQLFKNNQHSSTNSSSNVSSNENYNNHLDYNKINQQIINKFILLHLLYQNGGIYISNQLTLVQSLNNWLQSIQYQSFINTANLYHNYQPNSTQSNNSIQQQVKCIGFFNNLYSSQRLRLNITRQYQVQKIIVPFPTLNHTLIACQKGAQFIYDMIQTYKQLIYQGKNSQKYKRLNNDISLIGQVNPDNIQEHVHLLSNQIVLQQRQNLLNKESLYPYEKLAIDYYGLITINQNIFFNKYNNLFELDQTKLKLYSFLSKQTIQQLQYQTGKLRYGLIFNQQLIHLIVNRLFHSQQYINSNSFIYHYFYTHLFGLQFNNKQLNNQKVIINDEINSQIYQPSFSQQIQYLKSKYLFKKPQIYHIKLNQSQNIHKKPWDSINKNIWLIWSQQFHLKSNLIIELCHYNLKKSAQNTGFTFHAITKYNIHQYLNQTIIQKIQYAIQNNLHQLQPKYAMSDLWRLALIYQHGGVYLDASSFTTQLNFNWLLNITQLPNTFLWNRYGQQPQNFFFWNAYQGCPTNWHINLNHNIKSQQLLSYQSNFIAAVKGSQFIKDWFNTFLQFMVMPYQTVRQKQIQLNIYNHSWIRQNWRYLLVMETAKITIANKNRQLENMGGKMSASEYYKIWSLPGQMIGQLKLRRDSNLQKFDSRIKHFEMNYLNRYRYEVSIQEGQKILGPLSYQTKFFGFDNLMSEYILMDLYRRKRHKMCKQDISEIIHPQSLLNKKLLEPFGDKLIPLIRYYEMLRQTKIKTKRYQKMFI